MNLRKYPLLYLLPLVPLLPLLLYYRFSAGPPERLSSDCLSALRYYQEQERAMNAPGPLNKAGSHFSRRELLQLSWRTLEPDLRKNFTALAPADPTPTPAPRALESFLGRELLVRRQAVLERCPASAPELKDLL